MKINHFLLALFLLVATILIATGCSETKKIYILDDCEDVGKVADLYASVSKIDLFLYQNAIDTETVDTVPYCGYILRHGDKVIQVDTIFTARQLRDACLVFFEIDTTKNEDKE